MVDSRFSETRKASEKEKEKVVWDPEPEGDISSRCGNTFLVLQICLRIFLALTSIAYFGEEYSTSIIKTTYQENDSRIG
jgi:hypothetical protein